MTDNIRFLSLEEVLEIHRIIISRSVLENESDNVLDIGLLESAVSQPQQTFFGDFLNPTIYDQAASYLFSIANNHAFENGNKRTASSVTIVFLGLNGYKIILSKLEFENLILDAVIGSKTKDEIADIFRNGAVQPVI